MLRPLAAAVLALLLTATPALAQWRPAPAPIRPGSGSSYDPQSGNMYFWNRSPDGSTNVRGLNADTGAQWNTTIRPNRDQHGIDSRGNSWNYNSSTGTYTSPEGGLS